MDRGFLIVITIAFVASSILAATCNPGPEYEGDGENPARGMLATRVAENRREATVVAKAVQNIQATNTAKENVNLCLQRPIACASMGMDWERTAKNCLATVEANPAIYRYSDCFPPNNPPTVQPIIQPPRDGLRPGRPTRPSDGLRPWAAP